MIKITNKNNEARYILTESERVSLASEEARQLVNNRLNNLDKYVNSNIDFFTGEEVEEDNKWYFNVNKDNEIYTCIYNNEHLPENKIEKEVRELLMWRHGDNISYVETVGDYIENDKIYKAKNETGYNDCEDYLLSEYRDITEVYEEIELNELNKEEVRKSILE